MGSIPDITKYSLSGVDGTATGSTLLYTTENAARYFYPQFVRITLTNVSVLTTPCTLSFGTNSSTYTNILSATALTGLTTTNKFFQFNSSSSQSIAVAANTAIYFKITVGAVATTYTMLISIYGDYD